MALTIEDGSNVVGANSYITAADARTYATARGITLSADDAVVEAHLLLAKDYLESFRDQYSGTKTNDDQSLQWPRKNVEIDGIDFDEDSIPQLLIDAQAQLAIEKFNGVDFLSSIEPGFVTHRKVGPIERKFSQRIGTNRETTMKAVDALLRPLFNQLKGMTGTLRI